MDQRPLGVSAPEGKDVVEVFVKVRSRPSILGKISNIMGARGMDILAVHGQASDDKKTADLLFYVEMGGSTTGTKELIGELRKADFVIEAESVPRNEEYFENFLFPLTSGGHYRVFAVGAAGWAALVKSIVRKFGSGGQTILSEEGDALGREMVDRIGNDTRFGGRKLSEHIIFSNLKGLFRASGLGLLDLAETGGTMKVTIGDTPTSSGRTDGIVDHFLVGVVKGAVEKVYGRSSKVEGLRLTGAGVVEFELHFPGE